MKKKMISILSVLCLFLGLFATGCGKQSHDGDILVYYLNLDGTSIEEGYFHVEDANDRQGVDLYLYALAKGPEADDITKTIPDSVKVLDYHVNDYFLFLNFSSEYNDIPKEEEVLIRAAIVRTLTQIPDVMYVSFQVEGETLTDARGDAIGPMSAENFVENPDAAINTSHHTDLTLYYASKDGSTLVPEVQSVYYSSNESLEKLIVKKLIQGPKDSDLMQTIPSSTNIITVSMMDGVCYVNLDSNFLNQNQEISEEAVLYSIVDSLTELEVVKKVQLSINGDTSGKVRYIYDLSEMYERNESLIEIPVSTEEETQE